MITITDCQYRMNTEYLTGILLGLVSGFIFGTVRLNKLLENPFVNDVSELVQTSILRTFKGEYDSDYETPEEEPCGDEIKNIFAEEFESRSKKALQRGREIGQEPTLSHTSSSGRGGYMTNAQLDDLKEARNTFKRLTKQEEIDILSEFSSIENMSYEAAKEVVEKEGYTLFVNCVSDVKMNRDFYSAIVIGVEIVDPDYDYLNSVPSPKARVTELLNVGGVN